MMSARASHSIAGRCFDEAEGDVEALRSFSGLHGPEQSIVLRLEPFKCSNLYGLLPTKDIDHCAVLPSHVE